MSTTSQTSQDFLQTAAREFAPSQFSDYRAFLATLYDQIQIKRRGMKYSYNHFSDDLGLGFGNVGWLIINSKRKMTGQTAAKIAKALALADDEKKYLNQLVLYNNAGDVDERQKQLEKLIALRNRTAGGDDERMVLDFYSHWLHAIIFELVGLEEFSSDPAWIIGRLHPKVTKKQIEASLALLEKLNLIAYDSGQQRHIKLVEDFESPASVPGIGVIQFHLKMMTLGMDALETVPANRRDFSAMTLSVSKEGRNMLQKELQRFRQYLLFLAAKDGQKEEIVEINFQMFELTKQLQEGRS